MPTLVYSPGVRAYIQTSRAGLVDVTEDIVSGNVVRNVGSQPSTWTLSLSNRGRKYDGLFTPNDRVTIFLKRLYWLQSISGYLDSTPYYTAKPGEVTLNGSCTLKYLQHFHWDPNTAASQAVLNNQGAANTPTETGTGTGNAVDRVKRVLTQVAEWDEDRIHIGNVPPNWQDFVRTVSETIDTDLQDSLGAVPQVGSLSQGTAGPIALGNVHPDNATSDNPAIGVFLETEGKCSYFGGPEDDSTRGRNPALTGSERAGVGSSGYEGWKDVWYVALRIPTQQWGNQNSAAQGGSRKAPNLTQSQYLEARRWWYDRKILVTNPQNGKQLVARVVDIGPNVRTGKAIDLSKIGLERLGTTTGQRLVWTFADDNATPGPVTASQQAPRSAITAGTMKVPTAIPDGASPGKADFAWGGYTNGTIPLSDMSKLDISGVRSYLHPLAAEAFMQMRAAADKDGINIRPKGNDSSYRTYDDQVRMKRRYGDNAAAPGSSNHGWGFAVDMYGINDKLDYDSPQYVWLRENGYRYGWVNPVLLRDGRGLDEAWHWEFWGVFGVHGRAASRDSEGNTSYQIDIRPGQFDDIDKVIGPEAAQPNLGGGSVIQPTGAAPTSGGGSGSGLDNNGLYSTDGWVVDSLDDSTYLGPILYANDEPILPTVSSLMNAAGRQMSSAPNGDLIGWFPDYFNIHNYAAVFDLVPMEIGDFNIKWSDDRLKTHFFVNAALGPGGAGAGLSGNITDPTVARQTSRGIASLEYPSLLKVLLGSEDEDALADTATLLKRFGVRPEVSQMNNIIGADAEYYIAVTKFMSNWASQFSASMTLSSFLPEIFPGMVIRSEELNLQAYVNGVTHNFSYQGRGFTTSLNIIAPSRLDGKGLLGAALNSSRELAPVGRPLDP